MSPALGRTGRKQMGDSSGERRLARGKFLPRGEKATIIDILIGERPEVGRFTGSRIDGKKQQRSSGRLGIVDRRGAMVITRKNAAPAIGAADDGEEETWEDE